MQKCTLKELQDHVRKLVEKHIEEKGCPPTTVHLPTELIEEFHERFHGGDKFLYENDQGKRCMLHIAKPVSVS